jgi:two-component system LytT family sensor kinase
LSGKLSMNSSIGLRRLRFYLWIGLAWSVLWITNYYVNDRETFQPRILNELWRNIYLVGVNYIFFEFSVPFIGTNRNNILENIIIGFFLLAVQLLLLGFGLYAWRFIGIQLHIYTALRTETSFWDGVSYQAQGGIPSTLFFGIMIHLYDHVKLRQQTQQLRIEKQEAELNYLKSQTNPHFLFNTLNNIYSLAKDKSDLAPESILRLSKILRFMLYETGTGNISIEQELKIISDYIALEKLRYDESLHVSFNYEIDDMKQPVPPLLLIPLVENAFKHGVSETRGHPFVDIHLSAKQNHLLFSIKNSTEEPAVTEKVIENIGLSNLRRQLELLYKNYSLTVEQGESAFTAVLKINLASRV